MSGLRILLPGITPQDAAFLAAHGSSRPDRAVDVVVREDRIRAKVLVQRSTQPQLQGRLVAVPEGTLVEGRLHYAAPLAYLLAYGLLTVACLSWAAVLAGRHQWAAAGVVGFGALVLLVVTWLSAHAGVAHRDQDVAWLEGELAEYFQPG